jgi:hypothetical protein
MTEPTPTRAPDAVPEAVLQAFGAWRRAMHAFSENDTDANLGDVRRAGREAHIAVATALREATATRDQEIARLTAEMAAAQADTARLDFLERTSANLFSWRTERVTGPARFSYCNGYQGATPRAAIDAARAAEDEP